MTPLTIIPRGFMPAGRARRTPDPTCEQCPQRLALAQRMEIQERQLAEQCRLAHARLQDAADLRRRLAALEQRNRELEAALAAHGSAGGTPGAAGAADASRVAVLLRTPSVGEIPIVRPRSQQRGSEDTR